MTECVGLYPRPRSFKLLGGASAVSPNLKLRASGAETQQLIANVKVEQRCRSAIKGCHLEEISSAETAVEIELLPDLHPQGYVLEWSGEGLKIGAGTEVGLHYALIALEQLAKQKRAQSESEWGHFRIEDEPEFPVRGFMLDIGRNKIPQMDTLYALIDRLSELKYNHLQLYMEGFCFDYAKYKDSFPEATPLTAAEFRELDAYARSRYIELTPNQNCLGHMGPWLVKPDFRDLAEHPDGMEPPIPLPFKLPPTTMNPVDDRSAALAKDLFDELLPNFSSEYVNLNMDEPFGLGTGRSKERADEIGVGELYFDYAEKMFEVARSHGKKAMMWGDVLAHHPEVIRRVPSDVTVLHWNYDAPVPYEPHCRKLQESGVHYYVCPGTSSWSSIAGRTDNMLANIADAARSGQAYGAEGLIVADWGDGGHWQVSAVSYPAIAYAAGVSWQVEANADQMALLEKYVSSQMLKDRSGIGGCLLMELGRYCHLERSTVENGTYTAYLLGRGLSDRATLERDTAIRTEVLKLIGGSGTPFQVDYRYEEMEIWLREREEELERLDLQGPDADLVRDELRNTLRLIEQGAGLHRYIFRQDLEGAAAEREWLERLQKQLETALSEFKRLWLARNREGGLSASTAAFAKLLAQYEEALQA
ncbi:family 20 glycosylhydrolase [Cohnella sp. LGH]|uniref:beta-N-acetylhexosaminidase n=1 Tax=Cohnella sp. LGH TaxID=1619153 RepID=UPI001ADD2C6A|nr:family 20 glycosylhydrolase [Cohnella sp. LGH]QTH43177.1 family 20 glycosylhydrolase [Cohnella sp. LGH]